MTLAEWLVKKDISYRVFAEMVGMSHTAVALWANGQRRPDTEETFHKIHRATRGEVTPNDFFGINGHGIKKKKVQVNSRKV